MASSWISFRKLTVKRRAKDACLEPYLHKRIWTWSSAFVNWSRKGFEFDLFTLWQVWTYGLQVQVVWIAFIFLLRVLLTWRRSSLHSTHTWAIKLDFLVQKHRNFYPFTDSLEPPAMVKRKKAMIFVFRTYDCKSFQSSRMKSHSTERLFFYPLFRSWECRPPCLQTFLVYTFYE